MSFGIKLWGDWFCGFSLCCAGAVIGVRFCCGDTSGSGARTVERTVSVTLFNAGIRYGFGGVPSRLVLRSVVLRGTITNGGVARCPAYVVCQSSARCGQCDGSIA